MDRAETILALETAIGGGSISVLRRGRRLASAEGSRGLSKSEDIFAAIEELLEKNKISRREIGTIAVSGGPGSVTGVRIGLAFARGLADSLPAKMFRISVLEALACRTDAEGRVLSAVYSERGGVFFREFWRGNESRIIPEDSGNTVQTLKIFEFAEYLKSLKREALTIVFPSDLMTLPGYSEIADSSKNLNFQCVSGNLAEIIGLAANDMRLITN